MYSKLAGLNLEVVPGRHTLKDKMSIKGNARNPERF